MFAGAKEVKLLEQYTADYGIDRLNLLVDWGWFAFITEPMFHLMNFFYKLVGNFGVAILLTTVVVKLLFFPLANKSFESMSKMKKLQPELKKIQERFKDDKPRQQQAMMTLYKKEKVNPMAGCLPIVIQIPVFFSLYKVLLVSIEMRHAPFFGWIKDLSAPDPTSVFNLFGLIPWAPPQFLMLGALPLVMGISMWVQMRLNPAPPDPMQQKIFAWMPVVFTFMLARFPAGLVLYWTWNNILSFTQQALIMKRQGVDIDIMHNVGIKKVGGGVKKAGSKLRSNGKPAEIAARDSVETAKQAEIAARDDVQTAKQVELGGRDDVETAKQVESGGGDGVDAGNHAEIAARDSVNTGKQPQIADRRGVDVRRMKKAKRRGNGRSRTPAE